ncbi:MAG: class I SAM-dependent methyltransferase [Cyclobacteriaceae bacterium]
MSLIYESILTCPICGYQQKQSIHSEKLEEYFCIGCACVITISKEECCVFCAYGSHKCLIEQGWELMEEKLNKGPLIISRNEKPTKYTPALGVDWLTLLYDLAIKLTMPERKFRNKLIDHVNPKNGEYILEFGFGTGANLLIGASKNPNSHFVGLDIDPKIREIAVHKLTKNQLAIPLELYEGAGFPFKSESFDKVYSCLVFHHLDQAAKQRALKEIHRVLKPGGKLIVGDWGKAKSQRMRVVFYAVQLLDGFKTTKDNVDGKIPEFIEKAGFSFVKETGFINTMIGSFCYYMATKEEETLRISR